MARGALRGLRGRDPLGLRRAFADRLLPALVAAMALLAALALAGAHCAGQLAQRWQAGAAGPALVTLPAGADLRAAIAALSPHAEVTPVPEPRMRELLAPWVGEVPGLPLPRILEVTPTNRAGLEAAVSALPGARLEGRGESVAQAVTLAAGLRALSLLLLLVIAAVAAALVAVATRAGIAARRETIVILHELGARDSDIAGRFAARLAVLCLGGAAAGTVVAAVALWFLAGAAVPVALSRPAAWDDLPWAGLIALPLAAAAIGWLTARLTLRAWLRRLP
ncbi:FtsX-like permease family protein [Sabulicella rubraurantiaca]|uniref:FtsX-like permease family protein n=1 Tax=Sabulicella rubraurantiaca TaxID=2811429 RepID=UPI001A96309B|nr:FtsX-like permease family protein [Sabulicella rubraurantiaca]